ncbi:MAG TPA: hypothetical protein VHD56_18315, partial [Tepidisphaeraceae bacterium]|nr:hypothetical protein [Tepidisphaeraceae bacterium]
GNESWVYNIAPSATISSTQLEDGFLKVQLGSFYDPSSADTSSGFHFGVRSTNRICNSDCGHVTLPA